MLATFLLMQPRIWLAFWAATAHRWLSFLNWHSKILLLGNALNLFSTQPNLYLGLPWARCRTLHMALVTFMRLAQAHLSGLFRSLWLASFPSSVSTQLQVICKLVVGALNSPVTYKGVKYHWSQHWYPRNVTHHLSPIGNWDIDFNSECDHPVNSLFSPSTKSILILFGN